MAQVWGTLDGWDFADGLSGTACLQSFEWSLDCEGNRTCIIASVDKGGKGLLAALRLQRLHEQFGSKLNSEGRSACVIRKRR